MSTSTTNQSDATGKSTQTFISALVLNSAIAGAELAAWLILRRFFPRIYQARVDLAPEGKRARPLPQGLLSAIPAILGASDEEIIEANGLDAYLFVRFIKLMTILFFGIAVISWAVLLPVYGTSTGGNNGLNMFTFGNVGKDQQPRLAAPLVICWVSTFFILWLIWREYLFFIKKRQEFLTSKGWSTKAQSRTVLVTGIPNEYCNVEQLETIVSGIAGQGSIRKIWFAKDVKGIDDVYDRRTKAVKKLEKADNKVIKLANKLVRKKKVPAEGLAEQEANGSILSRFIAQKKRPTHRLGKVPFTGKKVDSINWAEDEIQETNKLLAEQRGDAHDRKDKSSAFILFNDQIAAHRFSQGINIKSPLRLSSRFINVSPDDVIWMNMNVNRYDHKVRHILGWCATSAIIIFWSPITAFVSSIANVSQLCVKVSWLSWLCTLPTPVNGIIQGILPPLVLTILFALLPPVFKLLSKLDGTPLMTRVEMSLQKRYFAFLFVQGFIVATLASGVMAGISQITDNPSSAVSLLAQYLPSSSVFFLTLVVTSGLSGAAGGILQIARLVIYYIKIIILGGSPRAMYNIQYTMPATSFGTAFPAQLLVVVIALAYSTIAPLVCGFAVLAFGLYYIMFKYLFIWVQDQPASGETAGLFFKTALNQLFAGLYIEELCLIGLFFLARDTNNKVSAIPEGALMVVLLVITILFQLFLAYRYAPRVEYLPVSMAEQLAQNEERYAREMAEEKRRKLGPSESSPRPDNKLSAPVKAEAGAEAERQFSNDGTVVNRGGAEDEELEELQDIHDHSFSHPALWRAQPTVWLPRDKLNISDELVSQARNKGIDITNEDAEIDEKGKLHIYRDTFPGLDLPK